MNGLIGSERAWERGELGIFSFIVVLASKYGWIAPGFDDLCWVWVAGLFCSGNAVIRLNAIPIRSTSQTQTFS